MNKTNLRFSLAQWIAIIKRRGENFYRTGGRLQLLFQKNWSKLNSARKVSATGLPAITWLVKPSSAESFFLTGKDVVQIQRQSRIDGLDCANDVRTHTLFWENATTEIDRPKNDISVCRATRDRSENSFEAARSNVKLNWRQLGRSDWGMRPMISGRNV